MWAESAQAQLLALVESAVEGLVGGAHRLDDLCERSDARLHDGELSSLSDACCVWLRSSIRVSASLRHSESPTARRLQKRRAPRGPIDPKPVNVRELALYVEFWRFWRKAPAPGSDPTRSRRRPPGLPMREGLWISVPCRTHSWLAVGRRS